MLLQGTAIWNRISKTMYSIKQYRHFSELPGGYDLLFERGLFCRPEWFGLLMRNVYHENNELCLYAVERADSGQPQLLAPLRMTRADTAASGACMLASVSHPENFAETALMFAPDVEDRLEVLLALFRYLKTAANAAGGRRCDVLRLWPLAEHSELEKLVGSALKRAGFRIQYYANSYNRFESTAGQDYATYFAQRSANLRYSVRRRQRALEKSRRLSLAMYSTAEELNDAIPDYVSVSLHCWQKPSSMFNPEIQDMMRLAAAYGCLRLGILRVDGQPAAAQFWLVTTGVAHCARLAYHEDFKQFAVGVVLTNFMIAHVLDHDHVEKIDFGYGVEDYKGGWMKDARNYFGIMAFNPSTRAGCYYGAKHILGQPLKRGIKALLRWARLRR